MAKPAYAVTTETPLLRWSCFLLLGLTTLFITVNSFDSGIAKTPLLLLMAGLILALYLGQSIRTGQLVLYSSPADIPVLVFLALIVASTTYSRFGWSSGQSLQLWIPLIVCFFAGTHFFRTYDSARRLISALTVISLLVLVVGLVQFFFLSELSLDFFIGSDRRVTSTLTNSTYLSGYIVLVFPLLLTTALAEPKGSRTRWLLSALLAGLVFLLFATATRSSIAAFVVSMFVLAILWKGVTLRAAAWGAGAVLLVAAAALLMPHLAGRLKESFRNDASSTFMRRVYFWEAGYNAWKAAPFFGHGVGSYSEVMRGYRSPDYWVVASEDLVPHAHSEIVETAVDLGTIGVAVYSTILGVVLYTGIRTRKDEKRRDRLLRIGLSCSVLGIFVDNLASPSLRVPPIGATAWMLMGVLAAQGARDIPARVAALRMPRGLTALPVLLWLVLGAFYCVQFWPKLEADRHCIRGSLAVTSQNIPEAAREYALATSLDPRDFLSRSNLSLLLLDEGRFAEALKTSQELQALSPLYPKANLVQASALIALKKYPEALVLIGKELSLRNHPETYYYQAAAYMGIGDTAHEIQSLEQLLLADIRGRLPFELGLVSRRLEAIAWQEGDIRRLVDIYGQLSGAFPTDSTVALTLSRFRSVPGQEVVRTDSR